MQSVIEANNFTNDTSTRTMAPPAAPPEGFREVRCPLLELKDAHRIFVAGRVDAPRLVMMIPGYPDSQETFAPLGRRIAAEADCLVALTCQPEYDTLAAGRPPLKPSGYTCHEAARCLAQAVAVLRGESSMATAELILVMHDYGVLSGLTYANRALRGLDGPDGPDGAPPARIVCLDVLGPVPGSKVQGTARERAIHLIYQGLFAASFLVSRRVSASLAAVFLIIGIVPLVLFGRWLSPVGQRDTEPGKGGTVQNPRKLARMAYPCAHTAYTQFLSPSHATLYPPLLPSLPYPSGTPSPRTATRVLP